ncbi:glycosyltransferase family 2 protein [Pseudoruegeria sp. SK021]|uniref:glycosyltransferase family 2 protein n=1 Tax=Pseudoruegeria sp. SK021 TaxID=1933035 RepID=UPI000A2312F8|nr:glycosyltransferase family 2 protein [Pseudoruegeria sp. SK021]OSP53392.1 hypothetical protein BV911_18275 [Pseudoruegeria sp. SK021]
MLRRIAFPQAKFQVRRKGLKNLISLIIPCFNAEETLIEAYESLPPKGTANDLPDLQIMMVDDYSEDNTRSLIKSLAANDHRIVPIFNDKNLGVSASRNKAIAAAEGEFILFMDADDKLNGDGLKTLFSAISDDVDFVRGKHLLWDSVNDIHSENEGEERNFSEVCAIPPGSLPQVVLIYTSWNALFRRSVIVENEIKFCEDLRLGEDRHFNIQYLMACRKITLLNSYTYLWRKADNHGQQATQVLVQDPEHVFASIRRYLEQLDGDWFQVRPRHRSLLATSMLIETCNFMASFSKQIDTGSLTDSAKENLTAIISGLDPSWIDLELRNPKGRTLPFVPLYEFCAKHAGQNPMEDFFRSFQKTLSEIRLKMAKSNAVKQNAAATPTSVLRAGLNSMRARLSDGTRAIEVQVLHKVKAFDRAYYRRMYPDVAESGMDEVEHYLEFGASELRNPNAWFSTADYFQSHPEIFLSGTNPLVHFLLTFPTSANWTS